MYCRTIPRLRKRRNPKRTSSSSSSCFRRSGRPIPWARRPSAEREVYPRTSLLSARVRSDREEDTIVVTLREQVCTRQGYHSSYPMAATTSSLAIFTLVLIQEFRPDTHTRRDSSTFNWRWSVEKSWCWHRGGPTPQR